MSKSTATARSESTAKHKNKDNTDYIVTNLIDFLAMIAKRSKRRLNKEIFVCINIVLTKNWFIGRNFYELSNHHTEK